MGGIRFKWAAFTIAYYGANAVWQGYMSLYYRQLGFSEGRIGLIHAAMALCALTVQPVWGTLGDRAKKTSRLLAVLAAAAAAVLPSAVLIRKFTAQLLCACIFYIFYCALLPMGDSVLLERLNREQRPFGPYRLAGALSFALCGAVFGKIIEKLGVRAVVWTAAALLAMAAGAAFLLPDSLEKPRRKIAFAALLKDRDLMRLLAFMVPVQMTMGYFYTFFAPHFSALADGGTLGLGYGIATLSEIPYLLLSDRIFQKYGAARPMCISAAVLALRWLMLGLGKDAGIALASQLLHGGGFIVMTVSMAKYISRHVDENLRSSGQMLLSMASFGIARVAGNLGGGFLAERIGTGGVFLIGAGICLICACAFAPKAFRSRA